MAREAPKPRYVIKGVDPRTKMPGYFTEFEAVRSQEISLNGKYIGTEVYKLPKFNGPDPVWATKFDTEVDALGQIANQMKDENGKTVDDVFHGGPEAFSGATVEATWE